MNNNSIKSETLNCIYQSVAFSLSETSVVNRKLKFSTALKCRETGVDFRNSFTLKHY